jgi:hypothetical protein
MITERDLYEALQTIQVVMTNRHDDTTAQTFDHLGVDHDAFCSVVAEFHEALTGIYDNEQSMAGFIYGFLTGLACGRREE